MPRLTHKRPTGNKKSDAEKAYGSYWNAVVNQAADSNAITASPSSAAQNAKFNLAKQNYLTNFKQDQVMRALDAVGLVIPGAGIMSTALKSLNKVTQNAKKIASNIEKHIDQKIESFTEKVDSVVNTVGSVIDNTDFNDIVDDLNFNETNLRDDNYTSFESYWNKAVSQAENNATVAYNRQKEFFQNQHQWEAADLKAAGFNPVLTASGGFGHSSAASVAQASTPSMASFEADSNNLIDMIVGIAKVIGTVINAAKKASN